MRTISDGGEKPFLAGIAPLLMATRATATAEGDFNCEKASRVRLRQKRLLRRVGIKRRNVESVSRAAAGAERGHRLHERRG